MNTFLPERNDINPRWFAIWGETFGSAELAQSMSNNDRLFNRTRERMFQSMGIDMNAQFSSDDICVARTYASDRDRLARLSGLVIYGELLRLRIGKNDFDEISRLFSLDDLRIAVSLSEYHPPEAEFNADMSKLSVLVKRTGDACLEAWKLGLDEQMGMRIHLMQSDQEVETDQHQQIGTELAKSILVAVSKALQDEETSLAA